MVGLLERVYDDTNNNILSTDLRHFPSCESATNFIEATRKSIEARDGADETRTVRQICELIDIETGFVF